ncbi:DJ-1 family glyoxalase III [Anaerosphaera multitolerans]|uniref:DJ-1/PfpI family protein n=1 Tax=Anaerosphaera multitolerans TaxID=2487351 RepID=A0A437S9E0_9FIRM|nr:DJ-1 family glyoxalase III [Anaerosphaera multitolerans]RVU55729.1 DJ-1/PfpI family protein [Anaerosphaera multitolerans]
MKDLLIFLADGFEEIEALTVCDYLRRAELEVELVSISGDRNVKGAHNITVIADKVIDEINFDEYRAVYIPGGLPGATNLAAENRVVELVKVYESEEKPVAAICAGPIVFDTAGLLKEGKFTCYPGYEVNLKTKGRVDEPVVIDENVITSMGPSFAQVLAFEMIGILKDEKASQQVKDGVLFGNLVNFIKENKIK